MVATVWEIWDGRWCPRRGQCLAFNAEELNALSGVIRDLMAGDEMMVP